MDYPQEILKKLDSAKISDRIKITSGGKTHEGVIMPKTEMSSVETLVLKLESGYNVGIKLTGKEKIEKVFQAPKAKPAKKQIEQDEKLPAIALISTGGTIASKVDYETGGVAPALDVNDLMSAVPELSQRVRIKEFKQILQIFSEDIQPADWQKLAKEIAAQLNDPEIKGVVIAHGTDTMHYTSAAMSFMLKNLGKPVVFVGAQRSTDRGSADSAMNLICAANIAAYSDFAEVGVCMHANMDDDYCHFHRGTKVRKMHTSRRDALKSINDSPLASVWANGQIEVTNKEYKKRNESGKMSADSSFEEKVAIVKAYPGADPEIIDHYISKKYRGIIIEATGLGHVSLASSKSWQKSIEKAVSSGLLMCAAAQTLNGRLDPFVYATGRKLYTAGVIFLEDMLPETAYVKLGCALGRTKDYEDARKMMLEVWAGEINGRLKKEMF
ncbi:MAG: Glu-tRNA(Gln) amidotransferase subunit GatD [Candidatus Micrarchaeota archaeon]